MIDIPDKFFLNTDDDDDGKHKTINGETVVSPVWFVVRTTTEHENEIDKVLSVLAQNENLVISKTYGK